MVKPLTILILDDNAGWMDVLRQKLEDFGHTVYCAEKVKVAKANLEKGVDLALIDIVLKSDMGQTGYDVIEWIKKEGICCFVAAMSAIEENLVKIKPDCVDDKIEKPSNIDELVKIINSYDLDVYRNEKVNKSLILYAKRLDDFEERIGKIDKDVIYNAISMENKKHFDSCSGKFLTLGKAWAIALILFGIISGAVGWTIVTTSRVSIIETKQTRYEDDIKYIITKIDNKNDKIDSLNSKVDYLIHVKR